MTPQHTNVWRVLALAFLVFLVSACGGAEERKAAYLSKGKEYLAAENLDKARVELRNVLQIDPKHAEAYYLVGTIEEQKQNWNQAFGSYSKAVELDPANLDAQFRLGRLLLLSGNIEKAKQAAQTILDADSGNANGRLLLATINSKDGEVDRAIKDAEDLVASNPHMVDAVALLGSLYLKKGDIADATRVLASGVEQNQKEVALRGMLAQIYVDRGEIQKAERLLREVVDLDKGRLSYRVTLALFYARTQQPDKAEATLREAVDVAPDNAQAYLTLADFLVSQKRVAEAETGLLKAVKANPDDSALRFGLAKLYARAGKHAQATKVYEDIIDREGTLPTGLIAMNKLAALRLDDGDTVGSATLVEKVLTENPRDNDSLLLKGRLALMQKDPQTAITALRGVLRDRPNSIEVASVLADAHLMNNEAELARDVMKRAVEANPSSTEAELAYARYLRKQGDVDAALRHVEKSLHLQATQLSSLKLKAELLADKKDIAGVKRTIEQIRATFPENPIGYQQLGQYYLGQRAFGRAAEEFEAAANKADDPIPYLRMLVKARIGEGMPERALPILQSTVESSPDNVDARELLAELLIAKKDYDAATEQLKWAIKLDPRRGRPYAGLGVVAFARNDPQAAIAAYKEGLAAAPGDANLALQLAGAYERTGEFDKAIEQYERILDAAPNNVVAANNLAVILAEKKQDKGSVARAQELVARLEKANQPIFQDTRGWVYYHAGETKKAVEVLRKVVERAPEVPVFQYHLGMAYFKNGDSASAKTYLASAVGAKNDFPGKAQARETLNSLQ